MYGNDKIKFLSIDGISPNHDTIKDGSYPFLTSYYIVTLKDSKNEAVNKVKEAMISSNGQSIARNVGYIECYYKEGLWNHFRNTDTSFYGGQDYRIDSDFIVGYLDAEKKKIVLNPKYNRNHNYEGYVNDNELFHEIKGMTNDLMIKEIIKSEMALKSSKESNDKSVKEPKEELDISMISDYIEGLLGVFNSIKIWYPNGFYEERYRYLLEQLSNDFSQIKKAIPLLKSNAQIEQENTSKTDDFTNENVQFDDDAVCETLIYMLNTIVLYQIVTLLI